jgi:hypothetical protein
MHFLVEHFALKLTRHSSDSGKKYKPSIRLMGQSQLDMEGNILK